ncbi:hypothetical protein [Streptomyces sp. PTD5-9]
MTAAAWALLALIAIGLLVLAVFAVAWHADRRITDDPRSTETDS